MECKSGSIQEQLLFKTVRIKPKWNVNFAKNAISAVDNNVRIKPKWNVNISMNMKLIDDLGVLE